MERMFEFVFLYIVPHSSDVEEEEKEGVPNNIIIIVTHTYVQGQWERGSAAEGKERQWWTVQ